MPELPEVETIRRQLAARIRGKTIARAEVRYPKVVHGMGAKEFERALLGKKIIEIGRQGKLILIRLVGGKTLVVHLKMTGRLLLVKKDTQPNKSTEVVVVFRDGSRLHYDDIRRFGYLKIVSTSDESRRVQKEALGIDFFDRTLTSSKFAALIRSRGSSQIKSLLMDQSLISGVGNIYAQEACFVANLHPQRKASTLTGSELRALWQALGRIMRKAITCRGSSSDAYVDAFGKQGAFVSHLKVYGHEGEPCPHCKTRLLKKSIGGRGTVFCPKCQK